jgi:hypothetical protein
LRHQTEPNRLEIAGGLALADLSHQVQGVQMPAKNASGRPSSSANHTLLVVVMMGGAGALAELVRG